MAGQPSPWSVVVRFDDVPAAGRRFDLRADDTARAAVAAVAGVPAVARLEATFEVARAGADRLHVVGEVCATVSQTCVVTLEPITSEVVEPVDLEFAAAQPSAGLAADSDAERPEPLIDGTIDLGAIAVEFVLLGIDPYPRKAGAVFEASAGEDRGTGPFAALAPLKQKPEGTGE